MYSIQNFEDGCAYVLNCFGFVLYCFLLLYVLYSTHADTAPGNKYVLDLRFIIPIG
jgi:hypothetical protein